MNLKFSLLNCLQMLPSIKLIFITIVLSLSGSWHFGFEMMCLNPTGPVFAEFINETHGKNFDKKISEKTIETLWSWLVNFSSFGAIISTLCSEALFERFGRKKSFFVSILINSAGLLLSGLAHSVQRWEVFAVGRISSGFGFGLMMCLQPIYFTEITPDCYRGQINTMTGVLIESGYAFGAIMALPWLLGTAQLWPIMFYLSIVPNCIAIGVLFFVPESPKYLMAQKQPEKLVVASLKYFGHKNIQEKIKSILEEIEVEKKALNVFGLFKKAYLRRGLWIACLTQFAACFSGVGIISYFSTQLFVKVGLKLSIATIATTIVSTASLIGACVSSLIIDRVGRRPLIVGSMYSFSGLLIIFMIADFVSLSETKILAQISSIVCITSVFAFMFVYGIGMTTIQWFIAAELVPQNARSAATQFTMVLQWIFLISTILLYKELEVYWHKWTFLIFVFPTFILTAYFHWKFPETMGKSTLEIIQMMGYKFNVPCSENISM